MQKEFITNGTKETQELGKALVLELRGGEIICLDGELGAGKTTFTQGLLQGLDLQGPFTSPTFLVMKEYDREISNESKNKKIQKIYHIDAYRVEAKDLLGLGWKEMIANPENIIIIEWAERVRDIIPKDALYMDFEWLDENKRKIIFKNKL